MTTDGHQSEPCSASEHLNEPGLLDACSVRPRHRSRSPTCTLGRIRCLTIDLGTICGTETTLYPHAPLEWTSRKISTILRPVVVVGKIVVSEDRLRGGHATDPRFKTPSPRYGRPDIWSFLAQASSWPSGLVPATFAGKPTCAEIPVLEY